MADLFADSAEDRLRVSGPLADRMRPHDLEDVAGQEHLVGPGAALRLAIEEDRVGSSIFYGPPGTGKTTLARLIAGRTGAAFEELSAVNAGKADVQAVIARARDRLGGNGQRTILFLDEIHRFNKAQQDALLPVVESGLVTLIGATTENPYHDVIGALISRTRLYEFRALDQAAVSRVVERGAAELGLTLAPDVRDAVVATAGGDARSALSTLELAAEHAASRGEQPTLEDVTVAAERRPILYDRAGDRHYDTISAFIKSVRGSDPDAAIYYLASMLEGGEDPAFVARRLIILASEDIGNADPTALSLAVACQQAVEFIGLPEGQLPLAQTTIYLALAPKSNASTRAIGAAVAEVRSAGNLPPPKPLQSAATPGERSTGKGVGYRYPHDAPGAWLPQQYLPDAVAGRQFVELTGNGAEEALRQRLEELRRRSSS